MHDEFGSVGELWTLLFVCTPDEMRKAVLEVSSISEAMIVKNVQVCG
jgi:hypothetical protein